MYNSCCFYSVTGVFAAFSRWTPPIFLFFCWCITNLDSILFQETIANRFASSKKTKIWSRSSNCSFIAGFRRTILPFGVEPRKTELTQFCLNPKKTWPTFHLLSSRKNYNCPLFFMKHLTCQHFQISQVNFIGLKTREATAANLYGWVQTVDQSIGSFSFH